MTQLSGIFAALISAVSWALGAVLFKKLGEKTQSTAITAIKALTGTIILAILISFLHISLAISSNNLIIVSLSGILGIAIGDSLFFASLKRLSPVTLSIIMFAAPNILYGILGFVILKEMPSFEIWSGIVLVLSGLAFLLFPLETDDKANRKTTFLGIIFAFLSLLFTSLSVVFIKPIMVDVNSMVVTMYRLFFGSVFLLVYGIIFKRDSEWLASFSNIKYNLKFLFTVAIVTLGGFWLSLVAIKHCDVVLASSLMSLEPMFVLLFMIILGKHKIQPKECIGIFLAIYGIITVVIHSK